MKALGGNNGARAPESKNIDITDEYREMFVVEAREHLDGWETALLALETQPGNEELINEMFRAIHTLKGSAGFIGFRTLQELSHELESGLQRVRDQEAVLDAHETQLLFEGHDLSKRMVESFAAGREWDEDIADFLQKLSPDSAAQQAASPGPAGKGMRRLDIGLRVTAAGRESFLRAYLARTRLGVLGTIIAEQPAPESFKAAGGPFSYVVTIDTDRGEASIRTELNIDQIEIESISECTPETTASSGAKVHRGGAPKSARGANGAHHDEVVRVSVDRLDNLLNLVGELVVQNSNFISVAERLKGQYGRTEAVLSLEDKTEGLSKITRDLQDGIMKVRMLPINTVFMRFPRVVRDLAHSSGKQVTLDIFGGDTEIDKKVIDRIGDPLVHLVRNAVDHGIESPEARRAAGKSEASVVRLGAYQDGDHICVEVTDDGTGLDREAILAKARERGLVGSEAGQLSDDQVFDLIFLPGFSTAKRITDVSGRGVGMDVVKKAIEELGGSVRLRSFPSRGTTVTIVLPLTMAIIRAVLVEVDDIMVAIPLSSVKEILKFEGNGMRTVGGRHVMQLRDEVLAVVHMREVLDLVTDDSWTRDGRRTSVVVVDYDTRKIGLGVNHVVGTQEIVIKSLSRHYEEVDGFIGASILGDGRIALIADIEAIVPRFYRPHGAVESIGLRQSPEARSPVEAATDSFEESNDADSISTEEVAVEPEGEPEAHEVALPEVSQPKASQEEIIEALDGVGSSGAFQASMALSQFTQMEVRVGFPETRMVKIPETAELLGGEEAEVAGIYVGINGDLVGGVLIVISRSQLSEIFSLLSAALGTDGSIADEDPSVVAEFGNMLAASFINAMADETGKAIHIDPPEITVDMCLSVVDSVVARFNVNGDRILLTRASIYFGESEEVACNLLLFLESDSLDLLLESLAAVSS